MIGASSQSRGLWQFGGVCLAIALLLSIFVYPASAIGSELLHFVSGVFLGMSLVLNLRAFRMVNRWRDCCAS